MENMKNNGWAKLPSNTEKLNEKTFDAKEKINRGKAEGNIELENKGDKELKKVIETLEEHFDEIVGEADEYYKQELWKKIADLAKDPNMKSLEKITAVSNMVRELKEKIDNPIIKSQYDNAEDAR